MPPSGGGTSVMMGLQQAGYPNRMCSSSALLEGSFCNHITPLRALQVNPFEPETHWYTNDKQLMPLSARPEPKRRFRPSQWEEKK